MHDLALNFIGDKQNATCDFEIVCSGAAFSVHRLVLCMHSSYFKRLCESSFKESTDRKVSLHDDTTPSVQALVQYLYEFDYDNPMKHVQDSHAIFPYPRDEPEAHAQVFVVVDKYDIPRLRDLALEKFSASLSHPRARKTAIADAEALVAATPYIYQHTSPTDGRLRAAVVEAWNSQNGKRLDHAPKADFQALLKDVPEFAADLTNEISGRDIGSCV